MRSTVVAARGSACLTCLLSMLWICVARAATEVVPDLSVRAEANDNPRLRTGDEDTVAQSTAGRLVGEARISLNNYGERGEFAFEPAVRTDVYESSANEDLQSTDWYLRARGRRDWQ